MENWEKEVMTNPMIEYAAADSFVALDLLAAIVVQFDGYFITIEKDEAVTDDEKKCDDPRHDCESLSEENYSAKLIL
jgi:ribonuclease D